MSLHSCQSLTTTTEVTIPTTITPPPPLLPGCAWLARRATTDSSLSALGGGDARDAREEEGAPPVGRRRRRRRWIKEEQEAEEEHLLSTLRDQVWRFWFQRGLNLVKVENNDSQCYLCLHWLLWITHVSPTLTTHRSISPGSTIMQNSVRRDTSML